VSSTNGSKAQQQSSIHQAKNWRDLFSGGTGIYSLLALLVGIFILFVNAFLKGHVPSLRELTTGILEDFALTLISVFGVSYVYEKLSAKQQFEQFSESLQAAVERGETNSSVCEYLGILEMHKDRDSFWKKHNFADTLKTLESGDRVRITGRSLMNALGNWGQFQSMLQAGAKLELCMCDPQHDFPYLCKVARYLPDDTQSAWQHFNRMFKPWIEEKNFQDQVEVRFHKIDLLDTLIEIHKDREHRAAYDMGFGEGVERRVIFYLDALKPLGASLANERYEGIWQMATKVYGAAPE
jgi:hypothetical protein